MQLALRAVFAGGKDHRVFARRERQRRDLPFVRRVRIVREIPAREIDARFAEVCDLDPVGEVAVAVGERAAVVRHDLGDVYFVIFVAVGAQPRLIPRVVVGIPRRRALGHRPFAVFSGIDRVFFEQRQLHALAPRAGGRREHDRLPARARERKGGVFRALRAGGAPDDPVFARAEHFVREGIFRFVRAVGELVAGEGYRKIGGVIYLDPVVEISVGRGVERVGGHDLAELKRAAAALCERLLPCLRARFAVGVAGRRRIGGDERPVAAADERLPAPARRGHGAVEHRAVFVHKTHRLAARLAQSEGRIVSRLVRRAPHDEISPRRDNAPRREAVFALSRLVGEIVPGDREVLGGGIFDLYPVAEDALAVRAGFIVGHDLADVNAVAAVPRRALVMAHNGRDRECRRGEYCQYDQPEDDLLFLFCVCHGIPSAHSFSRASAAAPRSPVRHMRLAISEISSMDCRRSELNQL